jgi:16S rRNA (cytidine1402-2'-O)-methyltransferase
VTRRPGGTLWLVATPIGNLGDITPRAVEVLAAATLICCEDTRRTGRLLQHVGVSSPRLAVTNEHTERSRIREVLDTLDAGDDVAVVTDAGTPGISDPGERLVRAAIDAGHDVAAAPGPDAVTTALTISGLPTARYAFEGFLPRSGRARTDRLAELAVERRTIVIYESPRRVAATLDDLRATCGADRRAALCRELTKLHEEVRRGTLGDLELGETRGEFVIVLEGAPLDGPPDDDTIRTALRTELAAGATTRDAVAAVTQLLGAPKKQVYALALALPDAD